MSSGWWMATLSRHVAGSREHTVTPFLASGHRQGCVRRFLDIWRFEGDKLAENWVEVDNYGFLKQVGAVMEQTHLSDTTPFTTDETR